MENSKRVMKTSGERLLTLPAFLRYIDSIIAYKASKISAIFSYDGMDPEDVRAELKLHLILKLKEYDSAKGSIQTFIRTVLDNRIRSMVRDHFDLYERRGISFVSLDTSHEHSNSLNCRVARNQSFPNQAGLSSKESFEKIDFNIDLDHAKERLPPDLRDLSERLAYQSILKIAKELGVSRSKVYSSIQRLRILLEEAGFRCYC